MTLAVKESYNNTYLILLTSHSTTSETNQAQKVPEQKVNLKTNPVTHMVKQINFKRILQK